MDTEERDDNQPESHQKQHIAECQGRRRNTNECEGQGQQAEECQGQGQHTEECQVQRQYSDKCQGQRKYSTEEYPRQEQDSQPAKPETSDEQKALPPKPETSDEQKSLPAKPETSDEGTSHNSEERIHEKECSSPSTEMITPAVTDDFEEIVFDVIEREPVPEVKTRPRLTWKKGGEVSRSFGIVTGKLMMTVRHSKCLYLRVARDSS